MENCESFKGFGYIYIYIYRLVVTPCNAWKYLIILK